MEVLPDYSTSSSEQQGGGYLVEPNPNSNPKPMPACQHARLVQKPAARGHVFSEVGIWRDLGGRV